MIPKSGNRFSDKIMLRTNNPDARNEIYRRSKSMLDDKQRQIADAEKLPIPTVQAIIDG